MEPGARPLKAPFFTPAAPSPLQCNCTPLAKLVRAWSACYTGASGAMPADTTSWRSSSNSNSSSSAEAAIASASVAAAAASTTAGSKAASTAAAAAANGGSASTDAATASKSAAIATVTVSGNTDAAAALNGVPDDVWSSTTSVGLEVCSTACTCIVILLPAAHCTADPSMLLISCTLYG
eukprot:20098-Heterococcus_DN1.PRE.3